MKRWIKNWWSWTVNKLKENRGDIGQMFTPPKSKSPWEAATSGSTGGWAAFAGPSKTVNPNDPAGWGWVGPALTTAMGAVPGVGPALSAGMGALGSLGGGTGFQGTDKGWGNIGSTLLGTAGGYGLGTLGAGLSSGIQAALSPTATVGTGTGAYSMLGAGGGPATGLEAFTGGFGQGVSKALQPFGGLLGGAAGTVGAAKAATKGISALFNPMTILGAAGMAASRMPTIPSPPQIGPTVGKWLTEGAITKAGKLAQTIQETEFMGDFDLDKETQAYMEAMGSEIEKNYKQRVTNLDKSMSAMNPHWKYSGERLEMVRRINEEGQREQDLMRSQWILYSKQQYSQQKYKTVMDALDVDDTVKRELLYADIADIVWKYDLERDDVIELRTLARDAGMYMFEQGVGAAMA
jgi:hypothetical protein